MNRKSIAALAVLVLALLGLGALYWYQYRSTAPTEPPAVAEAPPAPPPPSAASVPGPPPIRHPIDSSLAEAPTSPTPSDPQSMWRQGLEALLGHSAVVRFIQSSDFSHRVVATVDNLARPFAPPRLWPVTPTPGRFSVSGDGELRTIAPENAGRYTPLVSMLTAVDAKRAAALYVRMYPQLQKAYEELGYPGRYFNDRVVEVIDNLLATPEPAPPGPLMQLTEVKGSVPSTQPWLRYEYADPTLEALSSGQRILLRVGATHRQALKAKLTELRQLVTRAPVSR
ncbi:MAG TPA: DUF3014 domain-containing protein [Burkholderiaceae bacterium]|nr:DUF3014 domain-containing protein [Burkholderiaceae bacterium]